MALRSIITFNAQLCAGIKWDEQARVFVTWAPSLQVLSQGKSETEAKRALTDAVSLLLTTAYDIDILETVLKGAGLQPASPSTSIADLEEYVSVQGEILEQEILEQEEFAPFTLAPIPIRLTNATMAARA